MFQKLIQSLKNDNMYEKYILNNKPSDIYAFSPRINNVFNEVSRNRNEIPKYSLVYIGENSFLSSVYFYKCSSDIVYIFLTDSNGIDSYYLLK